MGKKIFFFPAASIVHFGGASVAAIPARTALEYRRSQLHVYRKHLPRWQTWLLVRYLACKFRRQLSEEAVMRMKDRRRFRSWNYLKNNDL